MVVDRVSGVDWRAWCRRQPRGGVEEEQFRELMKELDRVSLSTSKDGWEWELNGGNGFTVASVRQLIDVNMLDADSVPTRWNVMVPAKVNIFAWRLMLNRLPTKVNLDRRSIDVGSVLCPICAAEVETVNHVFFLVRDGDGVVGEGG